MRREKYMIAMVNKGTIDWPMAEIVDKILWFNLFTINWGPMDS